MGPVEFSMRDNHLHCKRLDTLRLVEQEVTVAPVLEATVRQQLHSSRRTNHRVSPKGNTSTSEQEHESVFVVLALHVDALFISVPR